MTNKLFLTLLVLMFLLSKESTCSGCWSQRLALSSICSLVTEASTLARESKLDTGVLLEFLDRTYGWGPYPGGEVEDERLASSSCSGRCPERALRRWRRSRSHWACLPQWQWLSSRLCLLFCPSLGQTWDPLFLEFLDDKVYREEGD